MERESFENKEVAKILNESFIPIKIDREERPDIDRIYINYVQATTGGGGWPLNVFLTPDLEPLFGGTYWPGPESATQMAGHPGFIDILAKMRDVWQNQRRRCLDSAKEITSQLRQFTQEGLISHQDRKEGEDDDALDIELLEEAYEHFAAKFDPKFAGFGGAPKFPTPVNLRFMLRLGRGPQEMKDVVGEEECKQAERMVLDTLRAMWRGGIKDQIGNGFARYSVTRDWSLPHFEKMYAQRTTSRLPIATLRLTTTQVVRPGPASFHVFGCISHHERPRISGCRPRYFNISYYGTDGFTNWRLLLGGRRRLVVQTYRQRKARRSILCLDTKGIPRYPWSTRCRNLVTVLQCRGERQCEP
jgi:hypothetical protein